jgi:DNA repair protein RecO (recombination protein O)
MSRTQRRVELTPGYLLHRRSFRDTSLIIEFFTREHGRLTCFARGARGPKPRFFGLQPFEPLLLSWVGRGEAPQLTGAEPAGFSQPLPAASLMSGFYLNELMIKLTHQHDPHPELFELYDATLNELRAGGGPDGLLRRFEKRLLDLLGYGMELSCEVASQAPVEAGAFYRCQPGRGVQRADSDAAGAISGRVLLLLAAGEVPQAEGDARAARALMREALDHCLEGRELKTRAVARAVARLERAV